MRSRQINATCQDGGITLASKTDRWYLLETNGHLLTSAMPFEG